MFNKPMQREHFDLIRHKLNTENLCNFNNNGFDGIQNWAGQELFYEIPFNSGNFINYFKIYFIGNNAFPEIKILKPGVQNSVSSDVEEDQSSYNCTVSLKATTFVAVITYDDPLDYENIKLRTENSDWERIKKAVKEMHEQSNHFFNTAANIELLRDRLDSQRHLFEDLYQKDHLKLFKI